MSQEHVVGRAVDRRAQEEVGQIVVREAAADAPIGQVGVGGAEVRVLDKRDVEEGQHGPAHQRGDQRTAQNLSPARRSSPEQREKEEERRDGRQRGFVVGEQPVASRMAASVR